MKKYLLILLGLILLVPTAKFLLFIFCPWIYILL